MAMTVDEIDRALARWRDELAVISQNLLELEALPIYRVAREKTFTGRTRKRVTRALEMVTTLWAHLALLEEVVNKAAAARRTLPRFRQGPALAEIERLLNGPSVTLGVTEVPLEQRGLLSAGERERRTTPAALKADMAEAFAQAKAVFLDLDQAWKRTGQALAGLGARAERLQQDAEAYGRGTPAEISDLMARLASLRRKCRQDPLDAPADPERALRPYLEQAQARVAAFARDRQRIVEDLRRARAELESLRALRVRALELHQQCRNEVDDPDGPRAPGSLKELGEWLRALEAAHAEQRWEAARLGLVDWFRERAAVEARIGEAIDANTALLKKRQALADRWARARARTREHAAKGLADDRPLSKFAEKAEALLAGRTPLAEADLIIHSYEVRLEELIARLDS